MKIINHLKSFMEELKNPFMFIVFLTTSILFSHLGLKAISRVPNPETIPEIIKFYFKDAFNYFGDMFILFISGLIVITLGVFFIYVGMSYNKIFRKTLLIIIGLAISGFGLYLFSYFLLLLIALVIIAGLVWLFTQTSSNNRN